MYGTAVKKKSINYSLLFLNWTASSVTTRSIKVPVGRLGGTYSCAFWLICSDLIPLLLAPLTQQYSPCHYFNSKRTNCQEYLLTETESQTDRQTESNMMKKT